MSLDNNPIYTYQVNSHVGSIQFRRQGDQVFVVIYDKDQVTQFNVTLPDMSVSSINSIAGHLKEANETLDKIRELVGPPDNYEPWPNG